MARPTKQGIDYYSLDVNFLRDIKVRKIRKACGPQSIEILLCLLGNIYRDNGYYIGWDEDSVFLVADEVGAKEGLVEEVVAKAVQSDFFDKRQFDQHQILTSRGIQKRFFEATAKRKAVEVNKLYLVNDDNNPSSSEVNDGKNPASSVVNGVSNEQSKVKESKLNQSNTSSNAREQSSEGPLTSFSAWASVWKFPNAFQQQDLQEMIDHHGDELVTAAIKIAAQKDVKNGAVINFIEAVLQAWETAGVKSLDDARAYEKSRLNEQKQGKQRFSTNNNRPFRTETETDWQALAAENERTPEEQATLQAELDRKMAEFLKDDE